MLRALVQHVEIDVGEELRRQIADGQSAVRRLFHQALVPWHARQNIPVTPEFEVGSWIVHQHELGQRSPEGLGDLGEQQLAQNLLVDRDEEVREVALQVKRGPRPVLCDASDLRLEALRRVERAATSNACTRVCNERPLETRRNVVVQQVMDYPIAEVCGPYFAGLRTRDHEADRAAGRIAAVGQLVVQAPEIALQIRLESQRAGAVALRAPTIEIGLGEFGECETSMCIPICGRREREARCSCGCCSGYRC